jgi:hypothetical protein
MYLTILEPFAQETFNPESTGKVFASNSLPQEAPVRHSGYCNVRPIALQGYAALQSEKWRELCSLRCSSKS